MTFSEANLPTLAKYYLLLGKRTVWQVWLGRQSIWICGNAQYVHQDSGLIADLR